MYALLFKTSHNKGTNGGSLLLDFFAAMEIFLIPSRTVDATFQRFYREGKAGRLNDRSTLIIVKCPQQFIRLDENKDDLAVLIDKLWDKLP